MNSEVLMTDNNVSRIEGLFADVRSGLGKLRSAIEEISSNIDAQRFVSSEMVESLDKALEDYRKQAAALESAGVELSVPIGGSINDIAEAIRVFRDQHSTNQLRQLILDYFRLSTEAAEIHESLEISKRQLMEKCAAMPLDEIAKVLPPYEKAVFYVKNPDSRMYEDRKQIEAAIGSDLTYGIVYKDIVYDPDIDITGYLDGSCILLSPETAKVETTEVAEASLAESGNLESDYEEPQDSVSGSIDVNPELFERTEEVGSKEKGFIEGSSPETVDIHFELLDNQPFSALKTSEFRKLAHQKPGVVTIMHYLAESKLCETDLGDEEYYRRLVSTREFDILREKGYIAKLSVESKYINRAYYTLSDKGWACFKKQDIIRMLTNDFMHPETGSPMDYSMPRNLCISTERWNPTTAFQAAALRGYFTSIHQNALLFMPDKALDLMLGMAIGNDADTIIPAIAFGEEALPYMLESIRPASKSKVVESAAVYIVLSAEDIMPLCDMLKLTNDERQRVRFCVLSEDYKLYSADAVAPQQGSVPAPDEDATQQEKTPTLEVAATQDQADDGNKGVSDENVESEPSDFALRLEKEHAFIPNDIPQGTIELEISPAEEKKLTASSFISDLRKGNERACNFILRSVLNNNCITQNVLSTKDMPESTSGTNLDYLFRKGYLRRYTYDGSQVFYCPSPRLDRAMSFKDAQRRVGIRGRDAKDRFAEVVSENPAIVPLRLTFLKMQEGAISRIAATQIGNSFSGAGIHRTDCFADILNINNGSKYRECIAGAMWKSTADESIDEWMTQFTKNIEHINTLARLTVASWDYDQARALVRSLLDEVDVPVDMSQIYIYSLKAGNEIPFESASDADQRLEASDDSEVLEKTTATHNEAEEEAISAHTETEAIAEEKETETANDLELLDVIYPMLSEGRYYNAMAYARAASQAMPAVKPVCTLLAYALNDPMEHCSYQTDVVYNMIADTGAFSDALVISIALRTFYSNQNRYDYNIKSFYAAIKDYDLLSRFPALSKVVYTLMDFKSTQMKGMDAYAGYRVRNQAELAREIEATRREAINFYNNYILSQVKEKKAQKRFLETKKMLLDANGELGWCMKLIADNERDSALMISEFLQKHFFREGAIVGPVTIDSDMLWNYIDEFWNKAGSTLTHRLRTELTGSLKSNITSITMKAVHLLSRWCELMEQAESHAEDQGAIAYRKALNPLVENLTSAIADIGNAMQSGMPSNESAGLSVLLDTLRHIEACINGSYSENEHRYFYAPLLLTDDVPLNEDFCLDMELPTSDLQALQSTTRVLEHSRKLRERDVTYEERLRYIVSDQGDDFGTARLIVEYLSKDGKSEAFANWDADIEAGESYAQGTAELRKEDFIEELELAQSYGQIDNSTEDRKDRILQVINEWFDWAENTSNYGFFKKVMDAYLADIRLSAKSREQDLNSQLDHYRMLSVAGISPEVKARRIARIEATIQEQNYTVAEDLLARAATLEDETEDIIEVDFLQDFLDHYNDYYRPVASNTTMSSLVSTRTYNKEQRGAKRLADSWLTGGGAMGQERLRTLLNTFGFTVDSIASLGMIGKHEQFSVHTARVENGKRVHCPHPIAAFGSGAVGDGFRVVCVNGKYNADGLIEIIKHIGNSKHTLLLLDHALPLTERRRLARKSKNELGDRFFGVIDRVVMWFMIRNYDETQIQRMLIALIMPFGCYQPYVWESANVMPPEIFMGRKVEVEKIESANGVNIVYGGRQLGKSALLKKARDDINFDENGNRAVYIDIKGLDYCAAARKTCNELFDQGILTEDIDTEDWYLLARAVKRRLQSEGSLPRIPYLLLLLDEADAFIESSSDVNYMPFDALKDIQSVGSGRFKFVVAGLRNVVRFKREAALSNNSVLTHLQSMTVRPFGTVEARELLELPLYYLGLRFPKDKQSLITLILATTNYFPGLIQMYCAKLLEAMRKKDYAGYGEADTPIYDVSEEHIKKVLADAEFMDQIREKYFITLRLGDDNYYWLIALLVALLYHENGYSGGYTAEDIQKAGKELQIGKIAQLSQEKLSAFMDELQELNVLRKPDGTHYMFTRFAFFQMMGSRSDVEDKLLEYMED